MKLEEIKGNHCIHKIGIHFVFCTKFRHAILKDGIDVILKNIIGEICIVYKWKIIALEIMPDHVHLFLQIKHTDTPCEIIKTIKSISAVKIFSEVKWLKQKYFWGTGLWSSGAYYGSVGDVGTEAIKRYIEQQKSK